MHFRARHYNSQLGQFISKDPPGYGERTALITRFRRACPGSERTSDGYIERPIIPLVFAGIAEGDFQRQFGRSCIAKEIVQRQRMLPQ